MFGSIAARTDTKCESPRSECVEGRRNLCGERWMPLRDIEHQRADAQVRTERQCGGGQRGRLKHGTLWRATAHEVIPDPEAINRRCGEECSGAQPCIPFKADGAESNADWRRRGSRHV